MDYRTWPDFGMKYELTESMNRGRYEMMAPYCMFAGVNSTNAFFCFLVAIS